MTDPSGRGKRWERCRRKNGSEEGGKWHFRVICGRGCDATNFRRLPLLLLFLHCTGKVRRVWTWSLTFPRKFCSEKGKAFCQQELHNPPKNIFQDLMARSWVRKSEGISQQDDRQYLPPDLSKTPESTGGGGNPKRYLALPARNVSCRREKVRCGIEGEQLISSRNLLAGNFFSRLPVWEIFSSQVFFKKTLRFPPLRKNMHCSSRFPPSWQEFIVAKK